MSEAQRRQAFLQQLRNRLANATADEEAAQALVHGPELHLKKLVTKHGMEDWMQVRAVQAPTAIDISSMLLRGAGPVNSWLLYLVCCQQQSC